MQRTARKLIHRKRRSRCMSVPLEGGGYHQERSIRTALAARIPATIRFLVLRRAAAVGLSRIAGLVEGPFGVVRRFVALLAVGLLGGHLVAERGGDLGDRGVELGHGADLDVALRLGGGAED